VPPTEYCLPNSLPNNVVSANMINTFKNRLDKFWERQAVLYNYRANLLVSETAVL